MTAEDRAHITIFDYNDATSLDTAVDADGALRGRSGAEDRQRILPGSPQAQRLHAPKAQHVPMRRAAACHRSLEAGLSCPIRTTFS